MLGDRQFDRELLCGSQLWVPADKVSALLESIEANKEQTGLEGDFCFGRIRLQRLEIDLKRNAVLPALHQFPTFLDDLR